LIGSVVLLLMVAVSFVGPVLAPDPNAFDALQRLLPPSWDHVFGTDNLGRDVAVRVIFGGQASLTVGLLVSAFAVLIGSMIGITAAMLRPVDLVVMRIIDGVMSFPIIVLALSLLAIFGPGVFTVVLALTIVMVPSVARVVRGRALVVYREPMIDTARIAGASQTRILFTYVLPHCLTPVMLQAGVVFTVAVLVESSLSFIGAGLPPTVPSWGAQLAESRNYLQTAWWMWVFPGTALLTTVLSANLVIDGIRDALDPRSGRE
jgi:peptide/nickel transport system permease protein